MEFQENDLRTEKLKDFVADFNNEIESETAFKAISA